MTSGQPIGRARQRVAAAVAAIVIGGLAIAAVNAALSRRGRDPLPPASRTSIAIAVRPGAVDGLPRPTTGPYPVGAVLRGELLDITTFGSGGCPLVPTRLEVRSRGVVVITVYPVMPEYVNACPSDLGPSTSTLRLDTKRVDVTRTLRVEVVGAGPRREIEASQLSHLTKEAKALCGRVLHAKRVVSASMTTVVAIREWTVGPGRQPASSAFGSMSSDTRGAWCWTEDGLRKYTAYGVAGTTAVPFGSWHNAPLPSGAPVFP